MYLMYLKRKVCILLHNLLLRSFETSYFYTYKIKEDNYKKYHQCCFQSVTDLHSSNNYEDHIIFYFYYLGIKLRA